jgi:hypothetical protein
MRGMRLATLAAVAATAIGSVAAAPAPPGLDRGNGRPPAHTPVADAPETATGADDAVVIAVIDNGFTPYHLDFRADRMPQHLDDDPSNDLPLDQAPHEWLPGFPDPSGFASYGALDLTLPDEGPIADAHTADADQWAQIEQSTAAEQHYYYAPGTKVIGMLDFNGNGLAVESGASHGVGSSSVSAGALHGTCPECLVLFITYGSGEREAASDWAMAQPWIDVITNSYGYSLLLRDRIYGGSDTALQAEASERGQTILFSSGNGQGNTFTAPNTTVLSSQEGPDWIVTVGAVSPDGGSYTGAGKPADIAAPGMSYPSAPSSGTPDVDSQGTFSGTSNATPVVAGLYARSLWWARTTLEGPSRTQADGVVATGAPITCGDANPDCELGDGVLTAAELRTRLFHGAVHTAEGYQSVGLVGGSPTTPPLGWEHEFLSEGHGSYFGRIASDEDWMAEQERIVGPMTGAVAPLERPEGEADWFTVDSYCRQSIWGGWSDGYYVEGATELPAADHTGWPVRTGWADNCRSVPRPPALP